MSLPQPVELTIADDNSGAHHYLIALHPAAEGQRVVLQLMGLLAGPLAELVAAGVQGGGLSADVDFQGIGRQLGAVLLSDAPPRLVRELLRYANRDGRPLSNDHDFNVAYTGNYGELMMALKEVVQANRFLPLSRISAIASKVPPKAAQTRS